MNTVRFASAATLAIASLLSVSEASAEAPPGSCKQVCDVSGGYIPGAKKGDLLFKNYVEASKPGLVAQLLHEMGLERTHVGMMLSALYVRHNSMSKQWIEDNLLPCRDSWWPDACWLELYTKGLVDDVAQVDPAALKSGQPGLKTTQASEEYDPDGGGRYWRDLTLLRAKDENASRTRASRAADALTAASASYGLYAYSQLEHALARDGSSMCSGSMYQAWKTAEPPGGTNVAGGFSLVTQDVPYRRDMADLVYGAVLQSAADTNDGIVFLWDLEPNVRHEASGRISRQITNAMAFGEFQNFNSDWRARMGTGTSISPDDLALQGRTCTMASGKRVCSSSAARPYQHYEVSVAAVPMVSTCYWVCYD